jgi:hypothetical protein
MTKEQKRLELFVKQAEQFLAGGLIQGKDATSLRQLLKRVKAKLEAAKKPN